MKTIYDPVHGHIDVSEAELSIINTPAFQRLRRIAQLGLTSTVYPGATHTRFEHSLGVMHLAGEMTSSIGLSDALVQASRIAGLLHDVGHLPFSHTLEQILVEQEQISHEALSCEIVESLAATQSVEFPADPTLVKSLIRGSNDHLNVISNDIDVDRMDYLLRDSYQTGIAHGNIEETSIIKFATVVDGSLGFQRKALQSIEGLLTARLLMTRSVYKHDTVRITEAMLKRSVERFMNATGTEITQIATKGDDWLRTELETVDDESANRLYRRVRDRHLYKQAYDIQLQTATREPGRQLDTERECERVIREKTGVNASDVIVDISPRTEQNTVEIPIIWDGEARKLAEVSTLPHRVEKAAHQKPQFAVYADASIVKPVAAVAPDCPAEVGL